MEALEPPGADDRFVSSGGSGAVPPAGGGDPPAVEVGVAGSTSAAASVHTTRFTAVRWDEIN